MDRDSPRWRSRPTSLRWITRATTPRHRLPCRGRPRSWAPSSSVIAANTVAPLPSMPG